VTSVTGCKAASSEESSKDSKVSNPFLATENSIPQWNPSTTRRDYQDRKTLRRNSFL